MSPSDIPLRGRFSGIEVGRGVAASLVAAHHASHLVEQQRYAGFPPLSGLFNEFHVGVDFFFVLSGFLIAWVHWADIGRSDRLGRYTLRRITRIYPVYWAVLIPLIVARMYLSGYGTGPDLAPSSIIASLFLLPSTAAPILGVAWTLVFEIFFYIVFGLIILGGRGSLWLMALWGLATFIYSAFFSAGSSFPASFFLSPYNLEFLLGILVALILRQRRVPAPGLVASLGAGLFLTFMFGRVGAMVVNSELAMRAVFGIPAAIFILGVVEVERSSRIKIPPWLERFGAASYSIYLVHILIEPPVLALVWRHVAHFRLLILTLALAGIGIAGGIVFHQIIERPLTLLVRRATTRRVPATI